MITFSNLSLSVDRSELYIACAGMNSEQIAKVRLEYFENYSSEGASDKSYLVREYTAGSYPSSIYLTVEDTEISVTGTDTFINGLFYVYVYYYNPGDAVTLHTATGVVLDWEKVYVEAMSYLKNLATDCGKCQDNAEFIDFILRWKALKLAIETCDWDTVHCIWAKLFRMGSATVEDCGCGN